MRLTYIIKDSVTDTVMWIVNTLHHQCTRLLNVQSLIVPFSIFYSHRRTCCEQKLILLSIKMLEKL